MSAMTFVPTLKDFLRVTKLIYTVRKYEYTTPLVVVEGVGKCRRTLVTRIFDVRELHPYVGYSGFNTVSDWGSRIRCFIKPGEPRFLYKVEVM